MRHDNSEEDTGKPPYILEALDTLPNVATLLSMLIKALEKATL
jgi:hypothetical protein